MSELTELQSDIELLSSESEDDKTESTDTSKENKENVEDKEEKVENIEEEEDENIEEEKEEHERNNQFDRPTIKSIKTKYPEFFKDFPQLQNAFFREQEYTRIFPTIEDAKEAVIDNNAFTIIRDAALSGNAEPMVDAIDKVDKETLVRFSSDLLINLHKKDNDTYVKVITPLFENLARSAYIEGTRTKNEELANAAIHISSYLFGTDEVATGKRTFSEIKNDKPSKIDEERAEFNRERFQSSYKDVETRVSKNLKSSISDGLDPNNTMTPYIKSKLVEDIIDAVGASLQNDSTHMAAMSSAWARAQRAGFDSASISKIISAYLARAKQVMPAVRNKLRRDAIGEVKETSQNRIKAHEDKKVNKELPLGGSSSSKRSSESKKIDWSKTSEIDYLNDNITYMS